MDYRVTFGHIEIGELARKKLNEALDRNWVSEGVNVREFEFKFSKYFGYDDAVATSSGTDAGIVAMATLERDGEVITPALAFCATANCILAAGLKPVFVDIELDTLNIDPYKIEEKITCSTKAIQVVHTMGKPCKMEPILEIAKKYDLKVIEDCCEAHGASLNGKFVGLFGDMGLFSFYAAHLICSGEGGMISVKNGTTALKCLSIRSHGRRDAKLYFDFQRVGFNSKMNDMEAAVGLEGLANFPKTFEKRRWNLQKLWTLLSDQEDKIILYKDGKDEIISPHAFPLVLRDEKADMKKLYQHLDKNGIQCKTLFGCLPTQHEAFRFLGYKLGDFPVAERVGNTGLHFGVHQYLKEDDLFYAAQVVKDGLKCLNQ